jgi:metal-sulfur cluster biosynthetic enzyme
MESPEPTADLHSRAMSALRSVLDPEVGINIVDLGLVYGLEIDGGALKLRLTMTTPACPLGEEIVRDAEQTLLSVEGVRAVDIELVWDPPWTPDRMSELARDTLGWARP